MEAIRQLNAEICQLHKAHYQTCETGLINHQEAANANIIYHLYSDGEVTSQKGGHAYGKRSEFTVSHRIFWGSSPYRFPIGDRELSWGILTEQEAKEMARKMEELKKKV